MSLKVQLWSKHPASLRTMIKTSVDCVLYVLPHNTRLAQSNLRWQCPLQASEPLLVSKVRDKRPTVSVTNAGLLSNAHNIFDRIFGLSWALEVWCIFLELLIHGHDLFEFFFRYFQNVRVKVVLVDYSGKAYNLRNGLCLPRLGKYSRRAPHLSSTLH